MQAMHGTSPLFDEASQQTYGRSADVLRRMNGVGAMEQGSGNPAADHVRAVWAVADGQAQPDVAPAIASSWARSLVDHRIDPESTAAPRILTAEELKDFRDPVGGMIELGRPVLDRLYALVRKVDYVVLLADATGVVVDHRGDESRADAFKHWGLWRGAVWSEAAEGTNGIGTSIVEQRPTTVHCDQHFRGRNITLSCSGAPIFDPDGRLAAVLDISSMDPTVSEHAHALTLPVVAMAARALERRLFRERFARRRTVSLQRADGTLPGMMLALDDDARILGADHPARRLLPIDDATIKAGTGLKRYFELCPAALRSLLNGQGFRASRFPAWKPQPRPI